MIKHKRERANTEFTANAICSSQYWIEDNDLAFTLQTQYFKTGDGVARLSVVSHIGLKDLRFRMADGKHYNQLNIATVIFDDNGNYLTNGGKIVELRLLDSAFERWCSTGLTVKSGFELKPGKYLIRKVVRFRGAQMAARNGIPTKKSFDKVWQPLSDMWSRVLVRQICPHRQQGTICSHARQVLRR